MKLKEYLAGFKGIDRNLEVIYSIDDEGNAFHPITYKPTIGIFNDCDFESINKPDEIPNAVCVN